MSRSLPVLSLVSFVLYAASAAYASEGTPRPPCGQTLWVAGASTEVVVHPGAGQAIEVPLKIVPFADWNAALGSCAAPVVAVLSVQLKCNPDDGSPSVFVGPTLVPIDVPTTPGVQDLLTGAGSTPEFGGPYTFPIGADVLSPDRTWHCTVTMTYTVTFSGGTGNGVLTATRQTVTCIVPPSPADAAVARLELRHLDVDERGLVTRRRGDQAVHRFVVLNNDPTVGADLTFVARSFQIARLPSGSGDSAFSHASPDMDRDAFPLQFADLQDRDKLVPEGDPRADSDTTIERPLHVGPCDAVVISVLARSHGAASNGACAGITADLFGAFEDGTVVNPCVSAIQWISDVPAKSPLFELEDQISVGAPVDATWSPAVFDGDVARRTHGPGNLTDDENGTRAVGTTLGENSEFPESASDTLRSETPVDRCTFTVTAQDVGAGGDPQTNAYVVTGIAASPLPLSLRVFTKVDAEGDFDVQLDAELGLVKLFDRSLKKKKQQKVFDGVWSILIANPPSGYAVLADTTRTLVRTDGTAAPFVAIEPRAFARTIDAATTANDVFLLAHDPRFFLETLAWSTTSDGAAVVPNAPSGTDQTLPSFGLVNGSMASFPDSTVTNVVVTSAGATGSPITVPFVTRTKPDLAAADSLDVVKLTGKVNFTKDGKDKLVLKGTLPIEEGFEPKGATASFAIGTYHVAFVLDGKGKAKSGKHTFQVKLKKKNGTVQAGDRSFTLRLKKAELSGLFSHHFVRADAPAGIPIFFGMPVTAWLFDGDQTRTAILTVTAQVTPKNGTLDGVIAE